MEQTTISMQELVELAIAAAERSYSPYSHFRVGSALLLTNGETVTGTNVENVSYGLTICAERSALVRAVSQFGPAIRIAGVAVVNLNDSPSPPCGACRQMLAEFIEPEAPISFPASTGGTVQQITVPFKEVMPYAFDFKLPLS